MREQGSDEGQLDLPWRATMTTRTSQEQLGFARKLRREMSTAEAVLWRSLRNSALGVKLRRQLPIGPFVADFACVEAHLIVELDAEPHGTPERQDRDGERDCWLTRQGWRVLRFPNDVVIGGGDIVLDQIKAAIASRPSSDPR